MASAEARFYWPDGRDAVGARPWSCKPAEKNSPGAVTFAAPRPYLICLCLQRVGADKGGPPMRALTAALTARLDGRAAIGKRHRSKDRSKEPGAKNSRGAVAFAFLRPALGYAPARSGSGANEGKPR